MKSLEHFWKWLGRQVYVSYQRTPALPESSDVLLLGEGEASHKAEVWSNPRVRSAKAGARVHCINFGLGKLIVVEEPTLLLDS